MSDHFNIESLIKCIGYMIKFVRSFLLSYNLQCLVHLRHVSIHYFKLTNTMYPVLRNIQNLLLHVTESNCLSSLQNQVDKLFSNVKKQAGTADVITLFAVY